MGEIYNLTDKELREYRKLIMEQLNKFESTESTDNLVLFLIWLYEYFEMIAVNGKGIQAKLKHVKSEFNQSVLTDLFFIRGALVHRANNQVISDATAFYKMHKQTLLKIMSDAGFITKGNKLDINKISAF